jgi:hypothetical protein
MGVQKLSRLGSAVVWNVRKCLSLRNLKLNLRITQRVRSFIHRCVHQVKLISPKPFLIVLVETPRNVLKGLMEFIITWCQAPRCHQLPPTFSVGGCGGHCREVDKFDN